MSLQKKLEEAIWDGLEGEDHIYVDRKAGVVDTSGWQIDIEKVAGRVTEALREKGVSLIESRLLMAWQRPS